MYEYKLLVPKERVGVIIGDKGKVKRLIERLTNTKLVINNEEVLINGEDSLKAWLCLQVIKAISRGFSPKNALLLLKDNYSFEIINIMDYANNQNSKVRLRGRVIGDEGKTRRKIEQETNCKIVVFGKTIGVIGDSNHLRDAIEAVIMLLSGSQTNAVFKFLESKAKMRVRRDLL